MKDRKNTRGFFKILHDESISGAKTYIKQLQGPVLPQIKEALGDLTVSNKVSAKLVDLIDYKQWIYSVLSDYDSAKSSLTKKQEDLMRKWCKFAKKVSTSEISERAHNYSWWEKLDTNGKIKVHYGLYLNDIPEHSAMYGKSNSQA